VRGEDVTVKIVDGAVVSVAVDATLDGSQHRYAPDRNPARVYLMSLAVGSRRTMRGALETISQLVSNGRADALTLPWHELRYQHTSAIRSDLSRRYSPATTNKMLSAMKGVLKECWRLNYISGEQYQRARDVSAVRGSTLPRGRALSSGELHSLFEACSLDEKPVRGTRDAALVAVLYAAGLRRAEAVGLDVADFDPETSRLTVRGKGGKERYTYAAGGGRRGASHGGLALVSGYGHARQRCALPPGPKIRSDRTRAADARAERVRYLAPAGARDSVTSELLSTRFEKDVR